MQTRLHGGALTRKPHTRNKQEGTVLLMTVFILLGISLIGVASLSLTTTAGKVADRGTQKVQATALAEAGVAALYDSIRTQMVASQTYPTSVASTTLSSTMNSVSRSVGTYAAQIVGTPTSTTSDIMTSGVKTGVQTTWTFTLQGTGTASNGTVSTVRATYTGSQVQAWTSGSGTGTSAFQEGAMQSATNVQINTNGGFRVYDQNNAGNADIVANTGVGWNTYSGSKSSTSNTNIIDLSQAGQIMVPGSPSAAWTATTSTGTTGMGNTNGSKNYMTMADGSAAAANSIEAMSGPRSFPDSTQIATWQAAWLSAAQGTGSTSYSSDVKASTVTPNASNPGQGEHRITAPAYINGNLTVDSGQLYLEPNSDTTKSNVIYVTGNVTNNALLYNRGVVLVVVGSYTDGNSSDLYSLQTQYSPYSSTTAMMPVVALVSLKASATAVNLQTNSSGPAGLIYAANGGILVNGNNEIDGAMIAGGTGSNGGLTISPANGNSFVIKYYSAAVTGRTDFHAAASGPGSVTQAFTPTRFTSWVQTK